MVALLLWQAVYALEFLTAAPQDNVKLALKGGMVPVFIDIIKSSAAEDRTRIRALSTLTDNSRAYYRFSGWVARLTLTLCRPSNSILPTASAFCISAAKHMSRASDVGLYLIVPRCWPLCSFFMLVLRTAHQELIRDLCALETPARNENGVSFISLKALTKERTSPTVCSPRLVPRPFATTPP